MKFIHLSDIHLTIPSEAINELDPHARFAAALEHCLAHHPDAMRIVITGDLTHWGEPEAYSALDRIVRDFPIPVRLVLGNHDNRENFLSCFTGHPRDAAGFINYAEEVDELNFIYCDTNQPQTHAGHFHTPRIKQLDALLSASRKPALLFMHHNPGPTGMASIDTIGLIPEHSAMLADLLRKHAGKVRHIFFGHTHLTLSGCFAGVPYSCVRATGHQGLPNFAESAVLLGGEFEPNYAVVQIAGDHTSITHIPFAYAGPVRRSGTAWEDWLKPESAA